MKTFPAILKSYCYNRNCDAELTFKLRRGLTYETICRKCGITIVIDKFSPFLDKYTIDTIVPKVAEIKFKTI